MTALDYVGRPAERQFAATLRHSVVNTQRPKAAILGRITSGLAPEQEAAQYASAHLPLRRGQVFRCQRTSFSEMDLLIFDRESCPAPRAVHIIPPPPKLPKDCPNSRACRSR